jgi:formylglycine-generating enzyme required for sulfatase activity
VVFIDQFERLFDPVYEGLLGSVKRQLAACVNNPALPLRLVISIRTDFVGWLDRLRASLQGVLDWRAMLDPLDEQQALRAIVRPINGWGVTWEQGAAEAVLAYLSRGEIEPPHLQLVCSQLYQRVRREGRSQITCQDVQALDLERLHRDYLERQLEALGEDKDLGLAVLKQLVNPQAVAIPKKLSAVLQVMELEQIPAAQTKAVIDSLVDGCVLRQSGQGTARQIEIAHDTLAREINARLPRQEARRQALRELVQRGLDDWMGHERRPLMGIERLRILDDYRDVLAPPLLDKAANSERELQAWEYLLHSALAAQRTALNLRAPGGRRALQALAQIEQPEATAALQDWTPPGMIFIPAGAFTMGSTEYGDEVPLHSLFVEAFWIDRFPATNAQYAAFLKSKPAGQRALWTEAGWQHHKGQAEPREWAKYKKNRNHPVVGVSWYQSLACACWMGKGLLSEAQWEKAASWEANAGRKRRFPWGDEFDKKRCNTRESGKGDTTPVGAYSRDGDSDYGCADMAGNVWEWSASLYYRYILTRRWMEERIWKVKGEAGRCGVAPGTALRTTPAVRTATSTIPVTRTASSAFVQVGRAPGVSE